MDASHPEEREGHAPAHSPDPISTEDWPPEGDEYSELRIVDWATHVALGEFREKFGSPVDAWDEFEARFGPPAPASRKSPPGGRKSPIPPDWEPDANGIAYAKECHPDIYVDEEIQKFRDHYLGTGGQKADWDAAWRSWCWKYERFECR